MTMSMVGPYLTTTKYNRKQKSSKSKRLAQAQADHEAWLKKMGVDDQSLKNKLPHDKKGRRLGINSIPDYNTGPRVTSDSVAGNGSARESKKYTGTLIKGVATMHKSNAIPISNREQAIEVSTMRRG
jgi:hypothetical protein